MGFCKAGKLRRQRPIASKPPQLSDSKLLTMHGIPLNHQKAVCRLILEKRLAATLFQMSSKLLVLDSVPMLTE